MLISVSCIIVIVSHMSYWISKQPSGRLVTNLSQLIMVQNGNFTQAKEGTENKITALKLENNLIIFENKASPAITWFFHLTKNALVQHKITVSNHANIFLLQV